MPVANFQVLNVKDVLSKLQSCITWTKKSSNGWMTFVSACNELYQKAVAFVTPVKTRFTSVSTCCHVALL